jgi:hypothetical protein
MDSSPTLQDFVLNLIYDPGARSAFELDPHGTLEAAGLGDDIDVCARESLLDVVPRVTRARRGIAELEPAAARADTLIA